jgi:Tol biopolymer transport system component
VRSTSFQVRAAKPGVCYLATETGAQLRIGRPTGRKLCSSKCQSGHCSSQPQFGVYQGEERHILDLDTGNVSDLPPCPEPCFSPRWSPDGRYIVEVAADHKKLFLLDVHANEWSQLDPDLTSMNFPRWSHDSRSIYVQDSDLAGVVRSTSPGIYRVPLTGGRAEKIVDLKGFRGTGSLSVGWSGIDPDDTPVLLRNVGTYDIYALALERE